jgi:methylglyoxal reductase
MLTRKLGSSGIDVSAIGFGAWAIGGWMWGGADENDAVEAIHAALDHGVNLIDTAAVYGFGRSEQLVGRAIQGRRDKVVLATKCGLIWDREEGEFHFHANAAGITRGQSDLKVYKNLRPYSIRQEIEKSLKNLQTDYIDLYQTHWQDSTTPIDQTMATLLDLKKEGKIRAIGVSNASLEQIKAYGSIDSDQERYSLLDRAIEANGIRDYCREHNISILPYSPLVHGLLTGKLRPGQAYGEGDLRQGNPRFSPENVERVNAMLQSLDSIAERHGGNIAQLIIAWTFSQPGITCVLCGARNARQAAENAQAGAISLSAEELATIRKAAAPFVASGQVAKHN